MQDFDLEDGLEPAAQPVKTEACRNCLAEVARTQHLCPRCGMSLAAARRLEATVRRPAPPTIAPQAHGPSPFILGALLVVLTFFGFWWHEEMQRRPLSQRIAERRDPAAEKWYVTRDIDSGGPLPTPTRTEVPISPAEYAAKERAYQEFQAVALERAAVASQPVEAVAPRPRAVEPPPAAEVSWRALQVEPRPTRAPAPYLVFLFDGTIYAVSTPPEDGSLMTLRLLNGGLVVVRDSDVDRAKTMQENQRDF